MNLSPLQDASFDGFEDVTSDLLHLEEFLQRRKASDTADKEGRQTVRGRDASMVRTNWSRPRLGR